VGSHFLIPYVPLRGHKDPDFRELSYGDSGSRGRRLARSVAPGSYLFFHTNVGGAKYITAYIQVERVLEGSEARKDPSITGDGRTDDWFFLGNKTTSRRLTKFLPFDESLARQLSLNICFAEDSGRSVAQTVGSATRSHRELTEADVDLLLSRSKELTANEKFVNSSAVQRHLYFYDEGGDIIPIDEVHKLRESEIQKLIRKTPSIIEAGARVVDFEKTLPDGDRLDLLLEDSTGALILAELKGPEKATDSLPTQLASYCRDVEREFPGRRIRKMIVCDGKVSPKLRKACANLSIEIKVFGVRLDCFSLRFDE